MSMLNSDCQSICSSDGERITFKVNRDKKKVSKDQLKEVPQTIFLSPCPKGVNHNRLGTQ